MHDIHGLLATLNRPRLLIRAARFGLAEYRRDIHLRRLLHVTAPPRSAVAVMTLIEIEGALEEQRRAGDPTYTLVRHIEVLIALMGEAQILRSAMTESPRLVTCQEAGAALR